MSDLTDGEWLTYWTARGAMLLLAVSLLPAIVRRSAWHRWLWTAACAVHVLHVACAFHFLHHWNHAAAYAATAKRTAELIGIEWGGGLYANDVLTVFWVVDIALLWRFRHCKQWSLSFSRWHRIFILILLFMAFNATVVFGTNSTRVISSVVCVLLIVLSWRQRRVRTPSAISSIN